MAFAEKFAPDGNGSGASSITKKKILTADILLTDVITPLQGNDALQAIVDEYNKKDKLKPDSKTAINRDERDRFELAVENTTPDIFPGGSSANTVVTLKKILPDAVDVTFLGVIGDVTKDRHSKMIQESLDEAGIKRIPPIDGIEPVPEPARSYVVMPKDGSGRRAIATYPGSAKDSLKANLITDDLVKGHDIVLVQGSLWQKLDETYPVAGGHAPEDQLGFADKLLKYRWKHGKDLWFAMPTQSSFGSKVRSHSEKAQHFRTMIKDANVILGNGEELSRVYTTDEERQEIARVFGKDKVEDIKDDDLNSVDTLRSAGAITEELDAKYDWKNKSIKEDIAISRLQDDLKQEVLLNKAKMRDGNPEKWIGANTSQQAFITLGSRGAAVVNKDDITYIRAADLDISSIKNTLGAGDTAYAGFLSGMLANQTLENAGKIGCKLAETKLGLNCARLPDPAAHFERIVNSLGGASVSVKH